MLFIKELKKICFSFVYILFVGLLLFSWNENFYSAASSLGARTLRAVSISRTNGILPRSLPCFQLGDYVQQLFPFPGCRRIPGFFQTGRRPAQPQQPVRYVQLP